METTTKRTIKSFEHGDAFCKIESENGVYTVSLFERENLVNSMKTTILEFALEMYRNTNKETIRLSENKPQYTRDDNPMAKIGCLHEGKAYCWACIDKVNSDNDGHDYAVIYLSNILPYDQHCAMCNAFMVKGTFDLDLFNK